MLQKIYALYKKSPKRHRKLKEIEEMLSGEDLDVNQAGRTSGVKPVRASGTRWLAHKMSALRKILEKFGVSDLSSSRSSKSQRIHRFVELRKYACKFVGFFLDLLRPVRYLSLNFQKASADPVTAIYALMKAFKRLNGLKDTPICEFLSVKTFLTQVHESEKSEMTYQNIQLKNVSK